MLPHQTRILYLDIITENTTLPYQQQAFAPPRDNFNGASYFFHRISH